MNTATRSDKSSQSIPCNVLMLTSMLIVTLHRQICILSKYSMNNDQLLIKWLFYVIISKLIRNNEIKIKLYEKIM